MSDRPTNSPDYMGLFLPMLGLAFAVWFVLGRA